MKVLLSKVCIITVLLFIIKQGSLTEQINGKLSLVFNSSNHDAEIKNDMDPTGRNFKVPSLGIETEENDGTHKLFSQDDNEDFVFKHEINQDHEFMKIILLEFTEWALSKLDHELKEKVQNKLADKNLVIDSSMWEDFSEDEIQKLISALSDSLSPFLTPLIQTISGIIPKNIFSNIEEYFNIPKKDEL